MSRQDVAFTPCDSGGFACAGFVDGTPYDIRLPETWNGTLLIYSHGLLPVVRARRRRPGLRAGGRAAPGRGAGIDAVADALLEQGYALAGAGARTGGWVIEETIDSIARSARRS